MEKSEEDWENKCMQIEDQRKEWAIIKWKKVEISSLHSSGNGERVSARHNGERRMRISSKNQL